MSLFEIIIGEHRQCKMFGDYYNSSAALDVNTYHQDDSRKSINNRNYFHKGPNVMHNDILKVFTRLYNQLQGISMYFQDAS